MRWPHQSCLLMHQSLMFSIQWRYTFLNFAGTNWMAAAASSVCTLGITASSAGAASLGMLTHHCILKRGSTTVSVRSLYPTSLLYVSIFSINPCSSSVAAIFFLAANRSSPTNIWAASLKVPSSLKTSITSN